jgi:hypothetical protein
MDTFLYVDFSLEVINFKNLRNTTDISKCKNGLSKRTVPHLSAVTLGFISLVY